MVHANFLDGEFRLWFRNQAEHNHSFQLEESFECGSYLKDFPESVIRMSSALSTILNTVEKLRILFDKMTSEDYVSWPWFLQQFPNVKVLSIEGENNYGIARNLLPNHEEPDDNLALLPALEEIELRMYRLAALETDWHGIQRDLELEAFQPFVSARQQAGRPVKVFLEPCVYSRIMIDSICKCKTAAK
jgi:hypothetical protein